MSCARAMSTNNHSNSTRGSEINGSLINLFIVRWNKWILFFYLYRRTELIPDDLEHVQSQMIWSMCQEIGCCLVNHQIPTVIWIILLRLYVNFCMMIWKWLQRANSKANWWNTLEYWSFFPPPRNLSFQKKKKMHAVSIIHN